MIVLLLACAPKIERGQTAAELYSQPLSWEEGPKHGDVLYLSVMVKAGSAYDSPGQYGLAALTAEAMVDAGAGERSAQELREALYPTANNIQVLIDREYVSFRLRCHRDHGELCLDLLADVLTAPVFRPLDVERLKDDLSLAVTTGVESDEEALGGMALQSTLFEAHPYGHPVYGHAGQVDLLTPADLERFHTRHYVRSNLLLGVSGPVTANQRLAWTERFAQLPTTKPPERILPAPLQPDGRELIVIDTSGEVSGFHLGHTHGVDRNHPDWLALKLAMAILGQHRESSGRLFNALRTQRGLNYGTYAYAEAYQERWENKQAENGILREDNHFSLWIRPTSMQNGPFALRLALDELEKFIEEGVSEGEFTQMKKHLALVTPMEALDPGRRLAYAMDARISRTPNPLVRVPGELDELTREQVNEALKRHIRPDQLFIVAVTGDGQELIQQTAEDSATPIVYAGMAPDAAQAERDAVVAGKPLKITNTHLHSAAGLFR